MSRQSPRASASARRRRGSIAGLELDQGPARRHPEHPAGGHAPILVLVACDIVRLTRIPPRNPKVLCSTASLSQRAAFSVCAATSVDATFRATPTPARLGPVVGVDHPRGSGLHCARTEAHVLPVGVGCDVRSARGRHATATCRCLHREIASAGPPRWTTARAGHRTKAPGYSCRRGFRARSRWAVRVRGSSVWRSRAIFACTRARWIVPHRRAESPCAPEPSFRLR